MACVVSTSRRFNGATITTTTTIMTRDSYSTTTATAVVGVVAAIAAAVAESSVDRNAATQTGTGTGTGPSSRWSAYSTLEDQSQEQPVSRARLWWGAQGPCQRLTWLSLCSSSLGHVTRSITILRTVSSVKSGE